MVVTMHVDLAGILDMCRWGSQLAEIEVFIMVGMMWSFCSPNIVILQCDVV